MDFMMDNFNLTSAAPNPFTLSNLRSASGLSPNRSIRSRPTPTLFTTNNYISMNFINCAKSYFISSNIYLNFITCGKKKSQKP